MTGKIPGNNGLVLSLLDHLNEAVAICSREGTFVYYNSIMADYLGSGTTKKPTLKKLIRSLGIDNELGNQLFACLNTTGSAQPFTTTVLLSDDAGFKSWCDILVEQLDENHQMLSIRDVSDKKLAKELLRFRVGFEKLVTHISTYFINLDYSEIDRGIIDALERIALFSEADRSGVYFFNQAGDTIETAYEWCAEGVPSIKEHMTGLLDAHVPFMAEKIRARETVSCNSIDELFSSEDARYVKDFPVKSFIVVPVVSSGHVCGIIGLSTVYTEKNWHGDIVTLLKMVGEIFANARERKISDEDLKKTLKQLRQAMGGIIQAMALTVESRDPYTAGHQRRVADLARAIAGKMGLGVDEIEAIRLGGIIHDLGKISVPAEILSKPGRISQLEFDLIKNHPLTAFDIIKAIEFPWPLAHIVLQHHERFDGSGYPYGLSGDEIHRHARILAVADVVEAMASHRPYRPALGMATAMEEVTGNRGTLYDPEVVDACRVVVETDNYTFK